MVQSEVIAVNVIQCSNTLSETMLHQSHAHARATRENTLNLRQTRRAKVPRRLVVQDVEETLPLQTAPPNTPHIPHEVMPWKEMPVD